VSLEEEDAVTSPGVNKKKLLSGEVYILWDISADTLPGRSSTFLD
jgi:hypothetical protein